MNEEKITLGEAPPFEKGTTVEVSQFNLAIGRNGVGKSILSEYISMAFDSEKRHRLANRRLTSINSTLGEKESFQSILISEIRGFVNERLEVDTRSSNVSSDNKFDEGYASTKLTYSDDLKAEVLTYLKKFNSKIIGFKTTDQDGLKVKVLEHGEEKLVPIIKADGFGMNSFIGGFVNLFLYKDNSKKRGVFIEEPENHLTPRLQMEFIQSIIEFCDKYDKMLYVNSHSPYIFREFIKHYKNSKYVINYIRKIDGYPKILKVSTPEEINEILGEFMLLTKGPRMDNRFTGTFEIEFD